MQNVIQGILDLLSDLLAMPFGRELVSMIISMIPIVELRGGLPVAISLGLDPFVASLVCIIGNLIPVPFILWFITPIFSFLKKTKILKPFVEKLETKAMIKKDKIENWEFWGLLFFVGIPLPGTGAWTGSLIASIIEMKKTKALLATTLGVMLAATIMLVISVFIKGVVS